MNRLLPLSLALATAVAAPIVKADGEAPAISANVALASDYIWRGMTQTTGEPAISGGFDYAHESGLYAGVWGSNVDFGSNDNMELDYYAGLSGEASMVGYDLGYISYTYPGGSGDFEEWYLGLSTTAGPVELGATYSFGVDGAADNLELSLGTDLAGTTASLTAGDYDGTGKYYAVGLSREMGGVELSVTATDFDADAGSASDEDAVVFAIAKSF